MLQDCEIDSSIFHASVELLRPARYVVWRTRRPTHRGGKPHGASFGSRRAGTSIALRHGREDSDLATTIATRSRTKATRRTKRATRAPRLTQLEADLPATLRDFSRRVRRGLVQLEKRIEHDSRDTRRQAARVMREASHRLGHLEAQGEREWRRQTLRARRATVALLRRLERVIEPPRKARRRSG